jgi:phenylacetate 2-hydroxylase
MASPVISLAVLFVLFVLWRWVNATDKPKIKGIPEIPGWPLFGSLFELGEVHAREAQKWAKKYGPVFQARLGNKVRLPPEARET